MAVLQRSRLIMRACLERRSLASMHRRARRRMPAHPLDGRTTHTILHRVLGVLPGRSRVLPGDSEGTIAAPLMAHLAACTYAQTALGVR